MIQINKTALVPYTVHEMFTLVNDIADYPTFLPWCKAVQIHSKSETNIVATIKMGGAGMEKSFTTNNVIVADERIEIRLQKGPFSHLQGHWNFQKLGEDGCKISMQMAFKISNPLLRLSLEPMFTKIANRLVDTFVERANQLYG
ncbi:type II toxin-antitoxin system RatA family toxin [Candidatus Halobeggiatoa sp. HSG11]|nr:type II toxin-antitoxin system RatA family toxin [Candidatus Halobeggiatoa sp. HSG11]